jgi:hypothetical protein
MRRNTFAILPPRTELTSSSENRTISASIICTMGTTVSQMMTSLMPTSAMAE